MPSPLHDPCLSVSSSSFQNPITMAQPIPQIPRDIIPIPKIQDQCSEVQVMTSTPQMNGPSPLQALPLQQHQCHLLLIAMGGRVPH
jgi:hypothetical protein